MSYSILRKIEIKTFDRPQMRKSEQHEVALKAWVIAQLIEQGRIDNNAVLASEYCLPSEEIRTDLAILTEEFIGIEIKGPKDSLRRLSRQIAAYGKIFDTTILVCSSTHIVRAMGRVPEVELWEVTSDYKLVVHQKPPVTRRLLPNRPAMVKAVAPRKDLIDRFHVDARETLMQSFQRKFSDPSARFWSAVGKSSPQPEHIRHLSRFIEQRSLAKQEKIGKDAFWDNWHQQAKDFFGDHSCHVSSVS